MTTIISILLYIWQLPQTIAALFVLAFIRKRPTKYTNGKMKVWCVPSKSHAFSLGKFIFVPDAAPYYVINHETGHSWQSLFLGPLYLFVIALPSVILYFRHKIGKHDSIWYHSRWPENWADRLGGVNIEEYKEER